ncbi:MULTISPECIES: YicC/YloC family endoribonuclease [Kosmotoga]|uniref:YicC domain protein n=1 Tax=Kosmotoga olearia (strain ATCC BAA-1733 / DSM 21960 / TBF 19.5.1) TaxID=521045 RepID=C5CGF1_KOSOT|nr:MULTISPECIES: YicC/YloC family endoribonuclease [Kosmotoga]ACR80532.1 domain of unknown function DUF1732 [Kosmotoga olearia TBF 19.5.1]MDI3523337.1 hypothetical protein [Kosmotoga sp.]MDK2953559.1 hypothetical protein [Kosmotoga sp.]OAA19401.1 hypothetical protein DU53_10120 [Kosmotoga sp. DU53]
MIRSMTGFARAEEEKGGILCSVELKSVNSKHLNIDVNTGGRFTELEIKASRFLRDHLRRGTIKAYIDILFMDQADVIQPDMGMASAYYRALNQLADKFKIADRISLDVMTKMKDILRYKVSPELMEKIWDCAKIALGKAVTDLNKDKEREGENLSQAIRSYLTSLRQIANSLKEESKGFLEFYREQLKKRVEEILNFEADKNRLEQEVVILAERADISEEIVRLFSHIDSFEKLLDKDGECGIQLDFLCQEMHREFSTIAAKSKKLSITSLSIEGRTLVNKIREQVQNIE